MRKSVVLAALSLLLLPPAVEARQYAILVGVWSYDHKEGLSSLPYAEANVKELAEPLAWSGYEVTLLTEEVSDGAGSTRRNPRQPTRAGIMQALGAEYSPDDTVIFIFIGHGLTVKWSPTQNDMRFHRELEELQDARLMTCICPKDCKSTDPSSMISYEAVAKILGKKGGAGNVFVFFDACRQLNTQAGTDPGFEIPSRKDSLEPSVRAAFACDQNRFAFYDDHLERSVFTHHLLNAFRGRGPAQGGELQFDQLFDWLQERVPVFESKDPKVGKQTPTQPDEDTSKGGYRRNGSVLRFPKKGSGRVIFGGNLPKNQRRKSFKNVTFQGKFSGTDFTHSVFEWCRFHECEFTDGAMFPGALMRDCELEECRFVHSKVRLLKLENVRKSEVVFPTDEKPMTIQLD